MPPTTPTTPAQPAAGHRPRRHVRGLSLIAAVAAGVLWSGSGAPALAADGCANAALRAQNGSTSLPECRAYEMVSPSYKQGFEIRVQSFNDEGTMRFFSTASLAGNGLGQLNNQYLATRAPAGWVTSALNPPNTVYGALLGAGAEAMSVDLDRSVWVMRRIEEPDDAADLYVRSADGVFTRIGQGSTLGLANSRPYVKLVSTDVSHVVFAYSNVGGALSEYVGTGNTGAPRPVSVDNHGQQVPGVQVGICGNTMSADGRVIVFSSGSCGSGDVPETQVWARVAGSATVAVSGSECTRGPSDPGGLCNAAAPAYFAGAAADGSRVLFTTSQQLVNGDTDQSSDLYACDLPSGSPAPVGTANSCATLTEVSGTASGAQADNVAAVSEDGSRVYFVAHGAVLADNTGVNDVAAVAGVPNLYLWTKDAAHPTGQTTFVGATDGSGKTTPDGRYYVFGSASKLVTNGPEADTDNAVDTYRYDSVTKTMQRLSTSTSGTGADNDAFNTSSEIVSADGSTVVFVTDEELSPADTNTTTDVYEWHQGQVSLISGAGGGTAPFMTASGRDIFFRTIQPLTAADGDNVSDIYDARIGGGFDFTQPSPCSGEECRGPNSTAPNLTQPPPAPRGSNTADAAPTLALKPVTATQRETLSRTGKISLKVTTNAPGTITATAKARLGGKTPTVATARRALTTPQTATLALTLSKRARTQLATHGRLTVAITITHSKIALGKTTTLKLTHTKATKKKH